MKHKPSYCELTAEQEQYIRDRNKQVDYTSIARELRVPASVVSAFMVKEKLSFEVKKKVYHKKTYNKNWMREFI